MFETKYAKVQFLRRESEGIYIGKVLLTAQNELKGGGFGIVSTLNKSIIKYPAERNYQVDSIHYVKHDDILEIVEHYDELDDHLAVLETSDKEFDNGEEMSIYMEKMTEQMSRKNIMNVVFIAVEDEETGKFRVKRLK